MFDMMKMMGKMKEVQEKMKEAQESLGNITATGESGAGLVKATVNGRKELIKVEVDDSLFSNDDKRILQDLIVAATNNALSNVDELVKEHMKKSTEGMLPNIPGLDLSNLMG